MAIIRSVSFCVLLAILWIPCLFIIIHVAGLGPLGDWIPGDFFAAAIAQSAPLIAKDASLFGELTPVAVAAGLTVLAPKRTETKLIIIAVSMCLIGWAMYLALSVLIEENTSFYQSLITVLEARDVEVEGGIPAIRGFVTGTRVFFLVVGASLIGIRLRKEPE
ncbi:hypothetical protein [Thalassobaculum salexigens]|uniref:hypothetical protein n=1 Tax=Thalassobaculum salexigens TaxID=455360 RepID=UPI0012EB514D|nr:hypothetical protein [Thalassobaculum salexigens]